MSLLRGAAIYQGICSSPDCLGWQSWTSFESIWWKCCVLSSMQVWRCEQDKDSFRWHAFASPISSFLLHFAARFIYERMCSINLACESNHRLHHTVDATKPCLKVRRSRPNPLKSMKHLGRNHHLAMNHNAAQWPLIIYITWGSSGCYRDFSTSFTERKLLHLFVEHVCVSMVDGSGAIAICKEEALNTILSNERPTCLRIVLDEGTLKMLL